MYAIRSYYDIHDYKLHKEKDNDSIISPDELADILEANASQILTDLNNYKQNASPALDMELTDIETLAWLQKFFASRLRATMLLADKILLKQDLDTTQTLQYLDQSIEEWKKITLLKEKYNQKVIPYIFDETMDYNNYLEVLLKERNSLSEINSFISPDLK